MSSSSYIDRTQNPGIILPSPLAPKSVPQVKQMAHDFAEEIVGLLTTG